MKREYKKWLTAALAASMLAVGASAGVGAADDFSDKENIAIGKGSSTSSYVGQTGNIAIGEDSLAWAGSGMQEAYFDFGQGGATIKTLFGLLYHVDIKDGTKLPGSIAIGKNSVARSGSTMIGEHGYQGKLGDTEITGTSGSDLMKYSNNAYATTIGANSYNSGAMANITGVFSIISSKYDGTNNKECAVQNIGSTIYGSLNSIESATSNSIYSGTASSVLGFANRTQNSNAALIWGSGNEITNSIENVSINYQNWGTDSASDVQKKAIKDLQTTQYAGGSVMAVGGGNKADYALYSQMLGVQNKITGSSEAESKFDLLDGYKNTVTKASNVTLIGTLNEVEEGAHYNKVIGDNHKIASGKTHNVILGSADEVTEHSASDAVVIGHNAQAKADKSVAIGSDSVAEALPTDMSSVNKLRYKVNDTEKEYELGTVAGMSSVASFSVGSEGKERLITNVAAGRLTATSTDAVNGSQLYAVYKTLDSKIDNIKLTIEGDGNIKVDGNDKETQDSTGKVISDTTGSTGGSSEGTAEKKDGMHFKLALDNTVNIGGQENAEGKTEAGTLNIKDASGNTTVTVNGADGSVTAKEFKVGDKTYINSEGINANDQKITKVAAGELSATSTDAVNGSQLYATNQQINQNTININKLGNRVDRVGAGAAALAALHPLDFDPDAKWDFAAGYGNYRGAHAAALGAFYRPNEDWMLSFGGSFGGGENMVNAGVSLKVGAGSSHVNTSKVAMAKEIKDLRGTVAAQDARLAAQDEKIAQLTALVNSLVGEGKTLPVEEAAEAPAEAAEYFTVDEVTLADQASKGKTAERVRTVKAEAAEDAE